MPAAESPTPTDGTVVGARGMVCSVDRLASEAGVGALRAGGTAADAAIATNAVLAVTCQHLCGLGGDLLAVVHVPGREPAALLAAGRAGSGSSAAALRASGHREVPRLGDLRAVTVPGCVDGWVALHERYGRLPLAELLAPARELAAGGFAASASLARASVRIDDVPGAEDYRRPGGLHADDVVTRPRVAETLDAIAGLGRDGFYAGAVGRGLLELGRGLGGSGDADLFTPDDLAEQIAEWVEPIGLDAWGHRVWTAPPPSQGYLLAASAWIADGLDVPVDAEDPAWPHLLSEAARWAGYDRPEALYDGADPDPLLDLDRLAARRVRIRPDRRTAPPAPAAGGGTTYLCTADGDGMAVSLIQSNAAGWGGGIVAPGTGVFLHNRGLGFSLEAGHPAELAPGRRPPHTLVPALVTAPDGTLVAVLGTMGGDTQPQIVLQLLARLLHSGASPGAALGAPRWFLGDGGFDTWTGDSRGLTSLEADVPASWGRGLTERGHQVAEAPTRSAGHAQVILRRPDGTYAGAADPRMPTGAAVALD